MMMKTMDRSRLSFTVAVCLACCYGVGAGVGVFLGRMRASTSVSSKIPTTVPDKHDRRRLKSDVLPWLIDIPDLSSDVTTTTPYSMPPSVPSIAAGIATSSSSSPTAELTFPGQNLSSSPSILPTIAPSANVSNASLDASSYPTSFPPPGPSAWPSESSTSNVPSRGPSSAASAAPSSTPTLECHDQASYRSPINGLTCADHRGTNCVHWRVLGLTTMELGDLVDDCPETCQIPCGSFVTFSRSIRVVLTRIPGLMDATSKLQLEEATQEYFLAFLQHHHQQHHQQGSVTVDFDQVELSSQTILPFHGSTRRLRLLQTTKEDTSSESSSTSTSTSTIEIRMTLEGFSIGISIDEVSALLLEGIESEAFAETLREADDFFKTVIVSSSTTEPMSTTTPDLNDIESTPGGTSTVKIVLSSLFGMLVLGSGAWIVVYHRRSGYWVPPWKPLGLQSRNEELVGGSPRRIRFLRSPPSSPRHNHNHNQFLVATTVGSFLSFDDSRASTHHAGNHHRHHTTALMRLIASFSLSRSKPSTEADDSSSHCDATIIGTMANVVSNHPPPSKDGKFSLAASQLISPMSDETEDEQRPEDSEQRQEVDTPTTTTEHPLSKSIPPMIVIDHIDEEEQDKDSEDHHIASMSTTEPPQVPTKRVVASLDLIAALKNPSAAESATILQRQSPTWSCPVVDDRMFLYLEALMDSDSDGEKADEDEEEEDKRSVASTPVHIQKTSLPKELISFQRSSSTGSVEVRPTNRKTSGQNTLDHEIRHTGASENSLSSAKRRLSGRNPLLDEIRKGGIRNSSNTTHHREASSVSENRIFSGKQLTVAVGPFAPPMPMCRTNSGGSYDEGDRVVRSAPSTPDRTEISAGGTSSGWRGSYRWSRSPISRTFRRPDFSGLKRFSSSASAGSANTLHHKKEIEPPIPFVPLFIHGSKSLDFLPIRYEFEAPRKGQLGLVLEVDHVRGCPMVHTVKDYSPLLGKVFAGDQIVLVDGKDTTSYSLSDMTRLLSTKPHRLSTSYSYYTAHTSYLRIAVIRLVPKPLSSLSDHQERPHHRDNSYGSSSTIASGSHDVSDDAIDSEQEANSSSRSASTVTGVSSGYYYHGQHPNNHRVARVVHFKDEPRIVTRRQQMERAAIHKPHASF